MAASEFVFGMIERKNMRIRIPFMVFLSVSLTGAEIKSKEYLHGFSRRSRRQFETTKKSNTSTNNSLIFPEDKTNSNKEKGQGERNAFTHQLLEVVLKISS